MLRVDECSVLSMAGVVCLVVETVSSAGSVWYVGEL